MLTINVQEIFIRTKDNVERGEPFFMLPEDAEEKRL